MCFHTRSDVPAAAVESVVYVLLMLVSDRLYALVQPGVYWKVLLPFHLLGWTAQFIGHFVFEGRRPALFDNLLQVQCVRWVNGLEWP